MMAVTLRPVAAATSSSVARPCWIVPSCAGPDLLRSMVAFWQNHPSLSYLFSGMYVGPTSQYPRVDEARMDALYELEVAFGNLPASDCPPYHCGWVVPQPAGRCDGQLASRRVLHRQALSSGGSRVAAWVCWNCAPSKWLRMSEWLVEMLLVRALICMFWKRPFEGGLVRWGTALHDRFMLPDFVKRDFFDVLTELRQSGLRI